MDKNVIQKLQNRFDGLSHRLLDESVEFWFARELQEPLGYAKWERFKDVVQRAIISCETTGFDPDNHFRGVKKTVRLGSGAERAIDDFMLTRYACYLIAQNGDPRKEPIAFAQSYFAIQTHKQELIESIVEGPQERYHLNWPGKREALLIANAPIARTLRPCREESVDFDTTKNLFIEGDNLEALKRPSSLSMSRPTILSPASIPA